jgi:RNA polymerase sigma-70 factor (ECF subfamily)
MDADDATLVARCRTGDAEAFRVLVGRHRERVYRAAYAVVADPAEAAEAAQDAWVKAWTGLRSFRGDAALGTWLTRMAVNAAVDLLRRRRRRAALDRVVAALPFPRPRSFEAVEDRDELRRALARLSPNARRLVGLRYGLGLGIEEIAAVLTCPVGTVKSRLHGATAKLRAALRDERPPVDAPLATGEGRWR